MRILLIAMPDTVDAIHTMIKLPNLAIASLAGNLTGHEVKTLDLVLFKPKIKRIIQKTIEDFQPQIVGLSAMTFQFDTLLKIANYLRQKNPEILLAAGGYHVSLMAKELTADNTELPVDFIIRGEGEQTFRELSDKLQMRSDDLTDIAGLSYKDNSGWRHNPDRPLLDLKDIALPDRSTRISDNFYSYGLKIDVAETSRGCVFDCKFCSITKMYGKNFRKYSLERILYDLKSLQNQGAQAVFFTDDNITYDTEHFRDVCKGIVDNRLNNMIYAVQASAAGLAKSPELVKDMRLANFKFVFVGFETMNPESLKGVKKPTTPEINVKAARLLHDNKIAMMAGTISGFPEDDKKSVRNNFKLICQLKPSAIYAQFLTPYPKTLLRDELLAEGLVINKDDLSKYDGFHCNIRTKHLGQKELYLTQRKEILKTYFNPSLIANNYFIRWVPLYFLRATIRNLFMRIGNILRGEEKKKRLDI
jgi:radical SAM superfamily enzyme YgiQ (UPF0313 family)